MSWREVSSSVFWGLGIPRDMKYSSALLREVFKRNERSSFKTRLFAADEIFVVHRHFFLLFHCISRGKAGVPCNRFAPRFLAMSSSLINFSSFRKDGPIFSACVAGYVNVDALVLRPYGAT